MYLAAHHTPFAGSLKNAAPSSGRERGRWCACHAHLTGLQAVSVFGELSRARTD